MDGLREGQEKKPSAKPTQRYRWIDTGMIFHKGFDKMKWLGMILSAEFTLDEVEWLNVVRECGSRA